MATPQETMEAAHRYAQQQQNPGPRPERRPIDKNTATAITRPTPSLDPRIVSNVEGYNDATAPYVQHTFDAFKVCHDGIQSVCDARLTVAKNTAWSEERRLLEVSKLAEKKQTEATKAFDASRKRLEQGIAALDESLNKDIAQDANAGSVNSEIRAHMKGLKRDERQKLLDSAFETNDMLTLRAVLSGPGYLSGISEDERKLRINRFHRMTQKDLAQRADVMKRALELIDSHSGLLFEQFEKAIGGTGSWQKVTVARQRVKAAEDALTR